MSSTHCALLYKNPSPSIFRAFYGMSIAPLAIFIGASAFMLATEKDKASQISSRTSTDSQQRKTLFGIPNDNTPRIDDFVGKYGVTALLVGAGFGSMWFAHRFARSHVSRLELAGSGPGRRLRVHTCAFGPTGINGSRPFEIPLASASISAKAFEPDEHNTHCTQPANRLRRTESSQAAGISISFSPKNILSDFHELRKAAQSSIITLSSTDANTSHRFHIDRSGFFPNPLFFDSVFVNDQPSQSNNTRSAPKTTK